MSLVFGDAVLRLQTVVIVCLPCSFFLSFFHFFLVLSTLFCLLSCSVLLFSSTVYILSPVYSFFHSSFLPTTSFPFTYRQKRSWDNLAYSCLYLLGLHCRVSQPRLPGRTTAQLFVAFMWLYVIIITTGYSSNLTAFLTVQRSPKGVETIRELYESRMPVMGLGEYFKYNMLQSGNPYVQVMVTGTSKYHGR